MLKAYLCVYIYQTVIAARENNDNLVVSVLKDSFQRNAS